MPNTDIWSSIGDNSNEHSVDAPEDSALLQKQLGQMEGEVKEMQMEIDAIRKNRKLFVDKNILTKDIRTKTVEVSKLNEDYLLDDNYNNNRDVSKLRHELIQVKNTADAERFQRVLYEEKCKHLEKELEALYYNGTAKVQKDGVVVYNSEIKNLRAEIQELNNTIKERTDHMQEYREKYLRAIQDAEELRKQVQQVEAENSEIAGHVDTEINSLKKEFESKLKELAPLPDFLTATQMELDRVEGMMRLSEDTNHKLREEIVTLTQQSTNLAAQLKIDKSLNEKYEETIRGLQEENRNSYRDFESLTASLRQFMKSQEEWYTRLLVDNFKNRKEVRKLKELCLEMINDNKDSKRRFDERYKSMKQQLWNVINQLEPELALARASVNYYKFQKTNIENTHEERKNVCNDPQPSTSGFITQMHNMEVTISDIENKINMSEKNFETLTNTVVALRVLFDDASGLYGPSDDGARRSPERRETSGTEMTSSIW